MKIENDLGRDDIRRLVLRLAIPSMLAQFNGTRSPSGCTVKDLTPSSAMEYRNFPLWDILI